MIPDGGNGYGVQLHGGSRGEGRPVGLLSGRASEGMVRVDWLLLVLVVLGFGMWLGSRHVGKRRGDWEK